MGRHVVTAKVYDKRGTLIAEARNSYTKTHPLMVHFGKQANVSNRPFLHAEVAALLRCGTRTPYRLHVERYRKDGRPALAKPCPICERAIAAWGVQRVTYTTEPMLLPPG